MDSTKPAIVRPFTDDVIRVPIVVAGISLALIVSIAAAPTDALAQRFHGADGRGVGAGHPVAPHLFVSRPFVPHPFVRRHCIRPFVLVAPVVVYAPPPVFHSPPAYSAPTPPYVPPAYYDPPPVYSSPPAGTVSVAPAPPSPPTPSVVEYPTGRYELRGDGVTTPYTWVWIPNPPPPPPVTAPPADAPLAPPASSDPSPERHSQLYRWTDEHGVVHWTDRLDAVPERYREQATQTQPS